MGKTSYSTLIVSPDNGSVDEMVNVASALGESVAVVDRKDAFLALYGPDVRCVVLELFLPDFSGLELVRHLGHAEYRGALVLTAAPQTPLDLLGLAKRLASAFGIVVVDMLVKPFDSERLLQTLIDATDPAVVNRLRADIPGFAACAPLPADRGGKGCNGSLH